MKSIFHPFGFNCRLDTIAMNAFEYSLANMPELRMLSKNTEHYIESDQWMITATRTESI